MSSLHFFPHFLRIISSHIPFALSHTDMKTNMPNALNLKLKRTSPHKLMTNLKNVLKINCLVKILLTIMSFYISFKIFLIFCSKIKYPSRILYNQIDPHKYLKIKINNVINGNMNCC